MDIPDNYAGVERLSGIGMQQVVCAAPPRHTCLVSSLTTSGIKILILPIDSPGNTTALHIRKFSQEYLQLLDRLPWAVDFFETASTLTDVKSLLPYYKKINDLIASREFDTCDSFLGQVRAGELSDVLLVGLLRLTNSWKRELPAWSGLLERSRKEISNRGHDSEILLKGLT
jgi:hypothetical protein